MASIIEFISVLFSSFLINLIPFAGPSNLLLASNAALLVPSADPFTLGFLVALGSAFAKGVHYIVSFFIGGHLSEKRKRRLEADKMKVRRWAFLLLYIAAASPIPDEPIVIPLGLMKYSPAKFFLSYFLGKISITIIGAYLGDVTGTYFSTWLSQEAMVTISVILTIIITVILLKVDLGKLAQRILRRKPAQKREIEQEKIK
jgi:membrane protein DedA with SNARE-associated domain